MYLGVTRGENKSIDARGTATATSNGRSIKREGYILYGEGFENELFHRARSPAIGCEGRSDVEEGTRDRAGHVTSGDLGKMALTAAAFIGDRGLKGSDRNGSSCQAVNPGGRRADVAGLNATNPLFRGLIVLSLSVRALSKLNGPLSLPALAPTTPSSPDLILKGQTPFSLLTSLGRESSADQRRSLLFLHLSPTPRANPFVGELGSVQLLSPPTGDYRNCKSEHTGSLWRHKQRSCARVL